MKKLPVIPTPPSVRWRDFRASYGPVVVFAGAVVCIAWLWSSTVRNVSMVGIGEGVRSLVSSHQPGVIRELRVMPYQEVKQGEVIGLIEPVDLRAKMDLLQARLQIARMRAEPPAAEGNAMNYERVRVELLRQRSELAIARVNLLRGENEVRRNKPLFLEKLVSEDIYDLSEKTRDMYQAEVTEKTKAVAEIEERLLALRPLGDPQMAATNDPMQLVVAQMEESIAQAATNFAPFPLVAPISGMVSVVYRQQGENVLPGEPLLVIDSLWAKRVIGYLRQPYILDPVVGMKVRVTTQHQKRREFESTIAQIGAQMEIITNNLAFIKQGALVDVGLPIVVSVPDDVRIRPGETVEIWMRSETNGFPSLLRSASAAAAPAAPLPTSSAPRP